MVKSKDPKKLMEFVEKSIKSFEKKIKNAPVEERATHKAWLRSKRNQLRRLKEVFM